MLIAHQLELDQVCYNALRASEVAYCLSAVQAQILLLKVITQKINYLHRSYDDLQYPLLFSEICFTSARCQFSLIVDACLNIIVKRKHF